MLRPPVSCAWGTTRAVSAAAGTAGTIGLVAAAVSAAVGILPAYGLAAGTAVAGRAARMPWAWAVSAALAAARPPVSPCVAYLASVKYCRPEEPGRRLGSTSATCWRTASYLGTGLLYPPLAMVLLLPPSMDSAAAAVPRPARLTLPVLSTKYFDANPLAWSPSLENMSFKNELSDVPVFSAAKTSVSVGYWSVS